MSIIAAIVLFGAVIFVHELGHFLFAKMMGVKVEKFALGFGPVIIGKKVGETEYILCALPLGGYVKMLGENVMEGSDNDGVKSEGDESGPDDDKSKQEPRELTPEELKRAFHTQPVWKKFMIVFMGPIFNIVAAAVILSVIYMAGVPIQLAEFGDIMPGTPAEQAGLQAGDVVVAIDETEVTDWSTMASIVFASAGKELHFRVKRGETYVDKYITPEAKEGKTIFGEPNEGGKIGVMQSGATVTRYYGPLEAGYLGTMRTGEIAWFTVVAVQKLIQNVIPADTMGGPILIFQMADKRAEEGVLSFFLFAAIISINLGVVNLLPIPVLDGGHIVFMAIEAVRRKPLSDGVVMGAQKVGLALLLCLMVFVFYNDIIRLISGTEIP